MKENIKKLLKEHNSLNFFDISKKLNITDTNLLTNILNELVDEGMLFISRKNKYVLIENDSNLKVGIIKFNKFRDAYLENTDILIKNKNLLDSINGDKVLIHLIDDSLGKVIKVLKRNTDRVIGTIIKNKFVPHDKRLNLEITINKKELNKLVDGSIVLIKLNKLNKTNKYLGTLINYIGHVNDPGIDILTIAYEHNINYEFSHSTINELNTIPSKVLEEEKVNRTDLTNEFVVTIDGVNTKDIDDAISLTKEKDVYKLGVHIADVSHYVKRNSPIYKDAFNRGNSYYLADKVIPMIPFKLSNGICSLNENLDRLAISVMMDIDKEGNIIKFDIFKSVINVKRKMNYEHINEVIKNKKEDQNIGFINNLLDLSKILKKKLIKNGYLNFYSEEMEIVQDKQGKCIDVLKRVNNEAEEIIEQFMIVTNEVVSSFISNLGVNSLYRVHDVPDIEDLEEYTSLIENLNIFIDFDGVSNYSYQEIINKINKYKEYPILSDLLLRSMKKAKYDVTNIGHFGLGIKNYTHFTAPIRRFSDLVIHHIVSDVLNKKLNTYGVDELTNITNHINECELKSIDAERKVNKLKMCEYMLDKVGNNYKGVISGVTNFGLFVKLDNLIEGLIHVRTLSGYFKYENFTLSSNDTIYKLGMEINVLVTNVSLEDLIIDFEVYDGD